MDIDATSVHTYNTIPKQGFATPCQYNFLHCIYFKSKIVIEGIHYLYISVCTSMTRVVSEILTCGELVGAGETKTSIGFNVNAMLVSPAHT